MGERDSHATDLLDVAGRRHVLVQQFRLRVTAGPDRGATFTSSCERATIGTQPAMDFVLRDTAMSRFHCEIALCDGRAVVRDLGSRNGTLVDGVSVATAYLHDGAILTLGRSQLRFELGSEQVKVPLSDRQSFGLLVGRSQPMSAVFAVLERAAKTDATLLLEGETGTGKDVAAESVHLESARRDGPLVVVDCGAIPAGLLESELFGHEKGAFTGADARRPGAFEAAAGGTLFLDEIGELAVELQPKLLRALETRKVQRVGSTRGVPVDVRVIAATSRVLKREVNQRRFRADLYYRLAVLEVTLPPLRERLEDLPLLVERFLGDLAPGDAAAARELRDPGFLAELAQHSWPGNARELRNYVERCVALKQRPPLAVEDPGGAPTIDVTQPLRLAREQWLRHFEQRYLDELLRRHGHNVSAAARAAGIARVHLHRLLARRRTSR